MTIFFYTSQPEIIRIIINNLQIHTCLTFTSHETLDDFIRNMKIPPDLLVIDYTLINPYLFDLNDYLNKNNLNIPYLLYNDPIPLIPDRALHWKKLLEYKQPNAKNYDWDNLFPIFEKIRDIIEDPNLSPYIKLMQQSKPVPKNLDLIFNSENKNSATYSKELIRISLAYKMPNNLFHLANCLIEEMKDFSSPKKIADIYSQKFSYISEASVKVQLSNLKKFFEHIYCRFTIITSKKGYKLVFI